MKSLRVREKPWSKTPAYAVRQYVEGVTSAAQGIEPFRFSEMVVKEIESRYWGDKATVGQVVNQATLDALVKTVGNDWNYYDRIVSSLRTPHDNDLASMKLLAMGDPKYRIARKDVYLKRRPWVSTIRVQALLDEVLSAYPWYESVRVDQEDNNVFVANVNLTRGQAKFIFRCLTALNGKHYVQSTLESTKLRGEHIIMLGCTTKNQVVGLVSGEVFNKGDNTNIELNAMRAGVNQIIANNPEEFYFETTTHPDRSVNPDIYANEAHLRPFLSSKKGGLPDFLPAKSVGALQDCFENLIHKQPVLKKEGKISLDSLKDWMKEYQGGMHRVSLHDMERKLEAEGIRIERSIGDVNPVRTKPVMPDKLFIHIDKSKRFGVAKRSLNKEILTAVNKFAESFFIAMTRLQMSMGVRAVAFAGTSNERPFFSVQPRACWSLLRNGKTSWRVSFRASNRRKLNSAFNRLSSWFRRNTGKVKVSDISIIRDVHGVVGTLSYVIPVKAYHHKTLYDTKEPWRSDEDGQEIVLDTDYREEKKERYAPYREDQLTGSHRK